MKNLVAALVVLVPLTAFSAPAVDGSWLGTLEVGSAQLRLGLRVSRAADGSMAATLDSLDQGSGEMKAERASFVAPTVQVEIGKLAARYVGTLSGDAITGTFTQGGHALPLTFRRVAAFERQKRPQEPKRPFPYREEQVTLTVPESYGPQRASAYVALTGTLSLPPGKGPFPAVLFITGSGPEDRDEQVFGHKPFLVVSDALVRAGIATLRFDDRGTGTSGGTTKSMTISDNASDARAELELLARHPQVDRRRLGIIGHSEGGLIAPMIAADSKLPRFLVLLAGLGVPGREILDTQSQAMLRASGATPQALEQARLVNEKVFAAVASEPDAAKLEAKVKAALAADPDVLEAALSQLGMVTPWLREFLTIDPKHYLVKVKVPVLALNGERDLQVDVSNLQAIERALTAGGNKHVKVVRLPELNHLFQHCKTGAPSEYSSIEETFSPGAIGMIRDFISNL